MRKIVAVDFDGTCVEHEYPEIGMDVSGAVETLKALRDNGVSIILWTMRSGEPLQQAVDWFAEKGIDLFGVNENPEQHTWTQSPKAYAQAYIDDAALGTPLMGRVGAKRPFVDWAEIEVFLIKQGFLTVK